MAFKLTKKKKIIVSIIAICRMGHCFSEGFIDSILNNNILEDTEIIIVEYGLKQDVKSYIDIENSFKGTNVQLHFCENANIVSAINFGAKMAKGDYLFFIDVNVIISDFSLEKMIKRLEDHNAHCIVPIIKDSLSGKKGYGGTLDSRLNYTWLKYPQNEDYTIPLFRYFTFLIKKDIFEQIDGFNENFKMYGVEDYEFAMRLSLFGFKTIIDTETEFSYSFKDIGYYGESYLDIVYNYLCLAYLHFSEDNFAKILKLISNKIQTPQALALILDNGKLIKDRNDYNERRKFNDNNFFEKFNINF